ncbi:MAG: type VI secretion system baseplate subunit TssG [Planctomycetes bacterium]|nr:type VI secretion system baseplate subunit TssG [Planctomycetota bacterium]
MTALDALRTEPFAFDFYRAMRLLECAFGDRERLGRSVRPANDPVRLGQQPGMAFPPGAVAGFGRAGRSGVELLRVHLFGLTGPNGPLPLHLTEYVLDRMRAGDSTLAAFLDVFHHRLLSLFWRAWADAQPSVSLDRPQQDRFGFWLACLFGAGVDSGGARDPRLGRVLRHWAGHLARGPGDAEGLAALLGSFFGAPVAIEPFVGRWLPIPDAAARHFGWNGYRLGDDAMLGDEFWDCTQTVRIVIGPLSLAHYERLLPGGASWQRLLDLLGSCLAPELAFEVRLLLQADEVPTCGLGDQRRLGWTSWLHDPPVRRGAAELTIRPDLPFRHLTPS